MFCVVCSLSLFLFYSFFTILTSSLSLSFPYSLQCERVCIHACVHLSKLFLSTFSVSSFFFFLFSTKTKNSFTSLPTNPLTWSSSNTPFYLILLLKVVWCGVCLRVLSHIVYNNFLPFNFFFLLWGSILQRRKVKSVNVLVFWENVNRTHTYKQLHASTLLERKEQNKKYFHLFRVLTFSSSSEIQDTYSNLTAILPSFNWLQLVTFV